MITICTLICLFGIISFVGFVIKRKCTPKPELKPSVCEQYYNIEQDCEIKGIHYVEFKNPCGNIEIIVNENGEDKKKYLRFQKIEHPEQKEYILDVCDEKVYIPYQNRYNINTENMFIKIEN